MPSTSGRIATIDASAAPISLPTSIRPVVSIVTWTCSGTWRPAAFIARRQPIIAAFTWSRSMQVSMRNRSTPPSRSAASLLLVRVTEVGERDVPEARQLRAGAHRAGDVARAAVLGLVVVGGLAGDARRGEVQLVASCRRSPYSLSTVEKLPNAGGLDRVDADVEERVVHRPDDVRAGEAEHLVAALEREAAEVVGSEIEVLDECAEGAVVDDDAVGDRVEVGLCSRTSYEVPEPTDPASRRSASSTLRTQ